jgi:serine/threonine protein phosphatase 1
MRRTFAIGDIHGDLDALVALLAKLPELDADDTLVFLGDYVDRGPKSAEVVACVRRLPDMTAAKVVCLRGNHEDAWLKVVEHGWPEFVMPRSNGCLEAFRSFRGEPQPAEDEVPSDDEMLPLHKGEFLPKDVVAWMESLPHWYEDEHAIYVHAGLPPAKDGHFPHPSEVTPPKSLLWCRDRSFFANYRGKLVVFGHTVTELLPNELSSYTPEDPSDLWAGQACVGLDTGAGKGGFLTALELPARYVYESPRPPKPHD